MVLHISVSGCCYGGYSYRREEKTSLMVVFYGKCDSVTDESSMLNHKLKLCSISDTEEDTERCRHVV